jgi:RNA polymerase sigma-70 factor (ECF subfamily)
LDSIFLDDLFRRYSSGVIRRAGAILGDRDAAKDVMQEVFLRALKARAEFSSAASPIAWLYRVTTNICLKRLRDSARHRRILSTLLPPAPLLTEQPVDSALTVRALMRHVPANLQEIAIYYFVDHMSQDEIALMVGLPRRTVGYRLEQFRTRVFALVPRRELAPS